MSKMITAMNLRGKPKEQEELIRLLQKEVSQRNERMYYITGTGRRIFRHKEGRLETVGVGTTVQSTLDPKELRKIARRIVREQNLKVRISADVKRYEPKLLIIDEAQLTVPRSLGDRRLMAAKEIAGHRPTMFNGEPSWNMNLFEKVGKSCGIKMTAYDRAIIAEKAVLIWKKKQPKRTPKKTKRKSKKPIV